MTDLFYTEKETSTASEDFKKNLKNGMRYVDKTHILVPLLSGLHETTFFLRPRRFGKTLMLSMIKYFIEDTRDPALNEENKSLFRGMKIMDMGERYTGHMASYPVIHTTFQTIAGSSFEKAYQGLKDMIRKIYSSKSYLMESERLEPLDKRFFQRILNDADEMGKSVTETDYVNSFKNLTEFLRKDSGKRAVVLIDEYDVPLEKAYKNGYYRQMSGIIGPMLQSLLKTNSENLFFAVVTGCLRIAKEGIYTGLNNPEINTVMTSGVNDYFGFTESEVKSLTEDSGFGEHFGEIKEWYDGYNFGSTKIYNPWSVVKHIEALARDEKTPPALYWAGTSENAIIRELAERADDAVREKIDSAMQGREIAFELFDNIVYDDIYVNRDNVFNVMLATGYLTAVSYDADTVNAVIPNKEVHKIYQKQIRAWFEGTLPSFDVKELYAAMEARQPERIQSILTEKFLSAMSYYDTAEAFYHGITLTLMQLNQEYTCTSNRESGSGRFDVQCKRKRDWELAFVLEFKVTKDSREMIDDAGRAALQIKEKEYISDLRREGYKKIITYGFSFCEKKCRAALGEVYEE